MTWIEVVDSAVKIGLGALIAGGFSYFNASLNLDSERRARLSTRRRDHLEKILELIAELENKYTHQKWRLESYRFYLAKGDNVRATEEEREFEQLDKQLYLAMDRIPKASTVLLLLGEKHADTLLWAFREAIDGWVRWSVLDASVFPESDKEARAKAVREAREKLLDALSGAYARS
ncbi:hypothetical protein D9M68_632950 [compost metagenome]